MPRLLESRVPSYRRHKSSGQAIVTLNGKDHLLGKYGTVASRQKYNRLITEWLINDRRLPEPDAPVRVCEVLAAFLRHAKGYYRRPDGREGNEVHCYKSVMRIANSLYGDTDAVDFGPLALKAVRQKMIEKGWCRNFVNSQTNRLRHIFKWASENEMIPASVWHGLAAVSGLRAGRTEARETEPVQPVSEAIVEATLPHLSPVVAAMVRVQLLTGARPGEVCAMRGMDLDTNGTLWTYTPRHHKTEHHGHERKIMIGPRAQEVIRPFLLANLELPLFSPKEAMRIRHEKAHSQRKTPLGYGNGIGTNRKPKPQRKPTAEYAVASYRRAIARACDAAGVPRWHPHQLRHTAATMLRKEYGLEAAQVILGHKTLTITQIYAEKNIEAARSIMAKVG